MYQNLKKPPGTYRMHLEVIVLLKETYYNKHPGLIGLISNDFDVRFFFHGPLIGDFVIGRVNKAEPLFVILTHEITSVVETRISGFFTEIDVTGMSLNCIETMVDFPSSQEFMEITSGNFLKIFT
ncbi:MAG: hypothetical protein KAH09_06790, partial [Desulfobacula sp.]|nr:hypothetical protein [Desulfobacula sp.]